MPQPTPTATPSAFAAGLAAAGHRASVPTVWLLEGLIGYLDRGEALALLQVGWVVGGRDLV